MFIHLGCHEELTLHWVQEKTVLHNTTLVWVFMSFSISQIHILKDNHQEGTSRRCGLQEVIRLGGLYPWEWEQRAYKAQRVSSPPLPYLLYIMGTANWTVFSVEEILAWTWPCRPWSSDLHYCGKSISVGFLLLFGFVWCCISHDSSPKRIRQWSGLFFSLGLKTFSLLLSTYLWDEPRKGDIV